MGRKQKVLLLLHILLAGLFFGITFAILIVTLIAYNTSDPGALKESYHILQILGKAPLRIATTAAILSGALLTVVTKRGLFRFKWIIAKELLSLLSLLLSYVAIHYWSMRGITLLDAAGAGTGSDLQFVTNEHMLLTGIILQHVSLIAIYAISVFKPWGVRKSKAPINRAS